MKLGGKKLFRGPKQFGGHPAYVVAQFGQNGRRPQPQRAESLHFRAPLVEHRKQSKPAGGGRGDGRFHKGGGKKLTRLGGRVGAVEHRI